MTEMVLPQFGMGMTDGTITAWHKAVGDVVKRGEAVCDVEAAKATVEVTAPCDGILEQIVVAAGTNVPVNAVIAIIADGSAKLPSEPAAQQLPEVEPAAPPPPSPPPPSPPPVPAHAPAPPATVAASRQLDRPGQGPQIEPRARRAARERQIDLATVSGSGPGGRIIEEDVLCLAQGSVPGGHAPAVHQLRVLCDAAPLVALLDEVAAQRGTSVTISAVLLRAAAIALAKAGFTNTAVGARTETGALRVIADPAAQSLLTLDAALGAAASAPSPRLIVEAPPEDWLDEQLWIDPQGPGSLSASALHGRDGGASPAWRVTLTFGQDWAQLEQAKAFLRALRGLLEQPLAILL